MAALLLQVLDALAQLHAAGLVLGDCKLDAFALDEDGHVVLTEPATVVQLQPGGCAGHAGLQHCFTYLRRLTGPVCSALVSGTVAMHHTWYCAKGRVQEGGAMWQDVAAAHDKHSCSAGRCAAGQDHLPGSTECTPAYAAPEQLHPTHPFTHIASDMFSWASSVEALLQHQGSMADGHGWSAATLREGGGTASLAAAAWACMPQMGPLRHLLVRCRAQDPAQRPTAAEAYDELAVMDLS